MARRDPDECPGGCRRRLLESLRGSGARCAECDPSERGALERMVHPVYQAERARLELELVCQGAGPHPCTAAFGKPAAVRNRGDRCDSCLDDLASVTELGGGVVDPTDAPIVAALFPQR